MKEGVAALAKVEEAYRHERCTKEAIEEVIRSRSLYHLLDTLEAAEDGSDENRLLPAMNKIWPFLVACVQHKNPVVRGYIFLYYAFLKRFIANVDFFVSVLPIFN